MLDLMFKWEDFVGLSPAKQQIIWLIRDMNGCPTKDLVERSGRSHQSLSRQISDLVKDGYVCKSKGKNKREISLSLSESFTEYLDLRVRYLTDARH